MKLTALFNLIVALAFCSLSHAANFQIEDPDGWRNSSSHLSTLDKNPTTRHHGRRWDTPHSANDDVWHKAICKGLNLLDAVRETDRKAAGRYQQLPQGMTVQSPFQNFAQEFVDWGWSQYDAVNIIDEKLGWMDWHGWGIADALKGLGVSDKVVDDDDGKMLVAWMHHGPAYEGGHWNDIKGKPYTHNGKKVQVILALDVKGPNHVVDWPTAELPQLRSGSDIMYGVWKSTLEGRDLASLRYYGVVGITNAVTKGIIVRAVEDDDDKVMKEWPGDIFYVGTEVHYNEKALALLGSPKAQALAYMLIQHKADMGKLRIIGVRVFLCNSENRRSFRMACMIWILKGEAPSGQRRSKN